ncbi:MAG: hypothetical protein PHH60_01890 [Candidatus Margulisbacteria bacterium]|nr:hypothetical protein [Candidatus Margulisiibacteriota bacterium]
MVIFVPILKQGAGPDSAKPFFERVLAANPGKMTRLTFRGLWIYFGSDTERVCHSLLAAGKLKFVAYPDRLELHQLNGEGVIKVIGRATVGVDGQLYVQGVPVADKNGFVTYRRGKPYRHVSADLLFPAFGKIRKTNCYDPDNARATIIYDHFTFRLSTDLNTKYGRAVRERRIVAVAGAGQIEFFEATATGKEEYIGAISFDQLRAKNETCVNVADYLDEFALKDLPIHLYQGESRVEHRGVVFLFSANINNIYYPDLLAGALFMRVGFYDRIEVVRKEREGETVIGAIPILDGRQIPLGHGRQLTLDDKSRAQYLRADRIIEELSGRDVPVNFRGRVKGVGARIYNLHFYFSMRAGNHYRPAIENGKMFFRVYRHKILVGLKEGQRFTEVGRLDFNSSGQLLLPDGRICRHQGKPVIKYDERELWFNLEKLLPELGVLEKRPAASRAIMYQEIRYLFDLKPGDVYFPDLEAGQLVFRATGCRVELFIDRERDGKEFIGSFGTDQKGRLLTEGKTRLEIKAGDRRDVRLSTLVKAFKPNGQEMPELVGLLVKKNYDKLHEIFSNGNAKKWLKMLSLFGRVYLADPQADEVIGVKVMFALAYGVEYLVRSNSLSLDLKAAFLKEIIEVMALALDNVGLALVKDSLQIQYLRALAASSGQPIDRTTEEQR